MSLSSDKTEFFLVHQSDQAPLDLPFVESGASDVAYGGHLCGLETGKQANRVKYRLGRTTRAPGSADTIQ